MSPGMLNGLRVLDLAGPQGQLCGRLYAELGADVVRLEPPGGDGSRHAVPRAPRGPSLPFTFMNHGKRCLEVAPTSTSALDGAGALAAAADVIIVSDDGALNQVLIPDPEDFQRERGCTVIYISPFGLGERGKRGDHTDLTITAMSGILGISGQPDEEPCGPPGTQAYYFGSVWAALTGLAAHYATRRHGRGDFVDVSLCEAMALQEQLVRTWAVDGETIKRSGSRHRQVCPSSLLRTRDGRVHLHVNHTVWPKLVEALKAELPEIASPDWSTMEGRLADAPRVYAMLEGFTSRWPTADLVVWAQDAGLACMPVNTPLDVLADPGFTAREFFRSVQLDGSSTALLPRLPYLVDGQRPFRETPLVAGSDETNLGSVLAEWTTDASTDAGGRASDGVALDGGSVPRGAGPLAGVRVVSFTSGIAGPHAGRVLAQLGAEVIKIESRFGGLDPFRFFRPPDANRDEVDASVRFAEANLNVRSVALNLKTESGVRIALELVATADLVLDNFRPGVLSRLGLSDEAIAATSSAPVVLHMPGFGTGAGRDHMRSWGPSINAFSGFTWLWNHPDADEPIGTQAVYPDYLATVFGPLGAVAGLLAQRSQRSPVVEYSQAEGAAFMLGVSLLEASVHNRNPRPSGNGRSNAVLAGLLRCAGVDCWCAFEVRDDDELLRLGRALSLAEPDGAGGHSEPEPYPAAAEVGQVLAAWAAEQPPDEVMRWLQNLGVPAGVVRTGKELVEDESFERRGFIHVIEQPEIGRLAVPSLPVCMPAVGILAPMPAAAFGADTEHYLVGELGYTVTELDALRRDDVLA